MKRIRTIRLKGCDLDKRLSEEKNVSFFLEPEYVYYPLKDFVFLKKIDDYVFEGDAILKSSKFDLYVNSSVSGYVISTDELMYDKSGNLEKFIKIKNDFKNNKSYEKRINIINSKNDLIKLCKEKGIGYARIHFFLSQSICAIENELVISGIISSKIYFICQNSFLL